MRTRKSWQEKMNFGAKPKVVRLEKNYAGSAAGTKMLVATPEIVRDYIRAIPRGKTRTVREMREDLARAHRAQTACPTSSGIFVRIVSEAALDELREGRPINKITPFWRVVDPESPAGSKISCGADFIREQRNAESRKK